MLCEMRVFAAASVAFFAVSLGCGADGGGGEENGGPLAMEGAYRLSCTIDETVLEIPIDVSYALDRAYAPDLPVELTYSAAVEFGEQASGALIDAGVTKIDLISLRVATFIRGATPGLAESALAAAPVNDFDLEPDTDDNGLPGPHRLALETVVVTSQALPDVTEVELGLTLDQISLILGDFQVPSECINPTLVGPSAVFSVR